MHMQLKDAGHCEFTFISGKILAKQEISVSCSRNFWFLFIKLHPLFFFSGNGEIGGAPVIKCVRTVYEERKQEITRPASCVLSKML